MPVKRRSPKIRLHHAIELTPARLEFLIIGHDYFDDRPFRDRNEACACWESNREEILPQHDYRIPPGCRPAAFWLYEQGRPKPERQAAALEALGLLDSEERAIVIALARAAWLRHIAHWNEPHRSAAQQATDRDLLDAWPCTYATEVSDITEGEKP